MAVTVADVAHWGKIVPIPTGDDLALFERVIAAVTQHFEDHYIVADPFDDSQELALMMQCVRLWRRRDTPEGVIAFDELGAVRVSRLDPDVATLLDKKINFA